MTSTVEGVVAMTRLELVERHPALAKYITIFVPGLFSIVDEHALVYDEEALAAFCAGEMLKTQGER
jgi:hypothetical protein